MENMWENEYVYIAARYSVVILCMIVFSHFELVTKYKNWEEIKQGNLSVALATGGKILGSPMYSNSPFSIRIRFLP